ncbi:hypothetical protein C8T65DRAFT_833025 [Cerioporus squamosus]|nr:hypothetical protein C8T65DRAFT_833025 [Cerioporus squamosus]
MDSPYDTFAALLPTRNPLLALPSVYRLALFTRESSEPRIHTVYAVLPVDDGAKEILTSLSVQCAASNTTCSRSSKESHRCSLPRRSPPRHLPQCSRWSMSPRRHGPGSSGTIQISTKRASRSIRLWRCSPRSHKRACCCTCNVWKSISAASLPMCSKHTRISTTWSPYWNPVRRGDFGCNSSGSPGALYANHPKHHWFLL